MIRIALYAHDSALIDRHADRAGIGAVMRARGMYGVYAHELMITSQDRESDDLACYHF